MFNWYNSWISDFSDIVTLIGLFLEDALWMKLLIYIGTMITIINDFLATEILIDDIVLNGLGALALVISIFVDYMEKYQPPPEQVS